MVCNWNCLKPPSHTHLIDYFTNPTWQRIGVDFQIIQWHFIWTIWNSWSSHLLGIFAICQSFPQATVHYQNSKFTFKNIYKLSPAIVINNHFIFHQVFRQTLIIISPRKVIKNFFFLMISPLSKSLDWPLDPMRCGRRSLHACRSLRVNSTGGGGAYFLVVLALQYKSFLLFEVYVTLSLF